MTIKTELTNKINEFYTREYPELNISFTDDDYSITNIEKIEYLNEFPRLETPPGEIINTSKVVDNINKNKEPNTKITLSFNKEGYNGPVLGEVIYHRLDFRNYLRAVIDGFFYELMSANLQEVLRSKDQEYFNEYKSTLADVFTNRLLISNEHFNLELNTINEKGRLIVKFLDNDPYIFGNIALSINDQYSIVIEDYQE